MMLENTLPIAGPINANKTMVQIGIRIQAAARTNTTPITMTHIFLDDEVGCAVSMIGSFRMYEA